MRLLGSLVVCAALWLAAGCSGAPMATPTPAPAAGVVLQKILNDCWGATQLKDLDGTRADHTGAFECARPRLLRMTRDYADAAEPHRLLAWGYYYALKDEAAAQAEYERAAAIYEAHGRRAEQSEMLVQLANLAFRYDRSRGCELLAQASAVDAENGRAAQLLRNFGCIIPITPGGTGGATRLPATDLPLPTATTSPDS